MLTSLSSGLLFVASVAASGCSSSSPVDSPVGDAGAGGTDAGGSHNDGSPSGGGGNDAAATADAGALTTNAPYHVTGPTILDAKGNPHLFRGLDRPSLEWSPNGNGNLTELDYITMAQTWHANVVRLSLNQDFWLQDAGNTVYDQNYADVIDQQVQWAEHQGMDVILDLHWSDKGDYAVAASCYAATNGNCQQDMADAHSVTFWQQVATKYKSDPQVLFELYNEPKIGGYMPSAANWTTWLSGGMSSGFMVHGMQELYDTVRATGAQNLVIIGGLDWSYDLSGVAAHPVNGTNIIYNTHPYNQNPPGTWDASFGSLSGMYPIIATEFGDHTGSCSTTYSSNFIAYANKKNSGINPPNEISWTAWAFFYTPTNPCTFPALLADGSYTPNATGMVVQAALIAGP